MYDKLKHNVQRVVSPSAEELRLIDKYFETRRIKKKEFFLQEGKVCDFIGYIESGTIRHFHVREGIERTCDISFEDSWITDFQSFSTASPSKMNLQALQDSVIISIQKKNLSQLYEDCSKYETFGRIMAERVAQRATDIAMSLSSDKPEERFKNLLKNQPDLFNRVPQKYIANFLGISPESLSRIQKRILSKLKS